MYHTKYLQSTFFCTRIPCSLNSPISLVIRSFRVLEDNDLIHRLCSLLSSWKKEERGGREEAKIFIHSLPTPTVWNELKFINVAKVKWIMQCKRQSFIATKMGVWLFEVITDTLWSKWQERDPPEKWGKNPHGEALGQSAELRSPYSSGQSRRRLWPSLPLHQTPESKCCHKWLWELNSRLN